jgi:hypothetical protein
MASIIFRFFGVYALFMAISLLGVETVVLFTAPVPHQGILAALIRFILPSLIMGALAFLLFAFSNQLASRILPGLLVDQQIIRIHPQEIQALLFSFAGIFVIAQGLNLICQSLTDLLNLSPSESTKAFRSWWMLAPGLLEILFGITIFIQARAISSLWYRIYPPSGDDQ